MVHDSLPITKSKEKLGYPKSIAFIVSNEFCERFNYYGMRAILVLYLQRKLDYDDDTSTVLFHIFTSLVYFVPLFGAILADSCWGKFKTILYLSVIYSIGSVVISLGAVPVLHLPATAMTVMGLLFIAVGTGGIKPCVSAFGGDQFKIPEQAKQLATFFSLFYFAINAGSLISTALTPILREDIHCFGENDCFSLAFGIPGLLMIISIAVFVVGKPLYIIKKPTGNMIVEVWKCIGNAISTKRNSTTKRDHWLDYAEPTYGKPLVNDVKALLKILVLYLPLPVFWALFDQQGSRWTFQATRMTGDIGIYTIKPDQMQVINPLLILAFIPLFDCVIYPILARCGIKRPLQKLTLGGILAGVAFLVSGIVELELQKTYPVLPKPGESQLRIFNGMSCDYNVSTSIPGHEYFVLNSLDRFQEQRITLNGSQESFQYNFAALDDKCTNLSGNMQLYSGKSASFFLASNATNHTTLEYYEDSVNKSKTDSPLIRILVNVPQDKYEINFKTRDEFTSRRLLSHEIKGLMEFPAGHHRMYIDRDFVREIEIKPGGVYTIIITLDSNDRYELDYHIITPPNELNMLWLIPQYVIITAGEVMFSVTGLEFSFTQAPASMKSVLQACWLLAVAFGNILVVVIAELRFFDSQANEFFLFAALMVIDMAIFTLLALRYTYNDYTGSQEEINDLKMDKDVQGITNNAYIGEDH